MHNKTYNIKRLCAITRVWLNYVLHFFLSFSLLLFKVFGFFFFLFSVCFWYYCCHFPFIVRFIFIRSLMQYDAPMLAEQCFTIISTIVSPVPGHTKPFSLETSVQECRLLRRWVWMSNEFVSKRMFCIWCCVVIRVAYNAQKSIIMMLEKIHYKHALGEEPHYTLYRDMNWYENRLNCTLHTTSGPFRYITIIWV